MGKTGKLFFVAIMTAVSFLRFGGTILYAYSDQTTTERILNENKAFIDFLDPCVTNFAGSLIDRYKEIYTMHFNADVAYLQSDYRGAFKRIYASQGKQVEFFSVLLKDFYLEKSKEMLDSLAPEIIRSKNARAKLYLTLAYRDRAVALNFYTIGDASNPKLYSYKIYKYVESIKMARRAKRYGFLALYESQTNEMKTRIFNHLFEMEREKGGRFYTRFLSKNGDAFLEELNRENPRDEEKVLEKKTGDHKDETTHIGFDKETGVYENKIEARVRFRNEKKVAGYLLNAEFEKAEDIIRNYIEDFNFKIIKSTIEVLSAQSKQAGAADEYDKLNIHHIDNYARLSKESALDSFAGKVKVEDYVDRGKPGELKDSRILPGDEAGKEKKDTEKEKPKDEVKGKDDTAPAK